MYRVFLGAPSIADRDKDPSLFHWQTISSEQAKRPVNPTQSIIFPPATLEAASRRISLIYKNIIFDDAADEEQSEADDTDSVPVGEGKQ